MYATVTDLQARWRTLDQQESTKAELILADVERDLRREFNGLDARMAQDPALVAEVTRITCNVARRRLVTEDAEDLDDIAENGGTYGRRVFLESESGLELNALERRILAGPTSGGDSSGSGALAAWSNDPAPSWPGAFG